MYDFSLPIEKALIAQGLETAKYDKLVVCCHQLADFGVPFHGSFYFPSMKITKEFDQIDQVSKNLLATSDSYIKLLAQRFDSHGSYFRVIQICVMYLPKPASLSPPAWAFAEAPSLVLCQSHWRISLAWCTSSRPISAGVEGGESFLDARCMGGATACFQGAYLKQ